MILLFAAISSERPFHKRDLLNVCCEPNGAPITFGYRSKWVSPTATIAPLEDRRALIVFTEVISSGDPESGAQTGAPASFRFHPIRLARITRATPDYDAVAFELELGRFADYKRSQTDIDDFLGRFERYVSEGERPHPAETRKLSRYVRGGPDFAGDDFKGDWISLVHHMRELEGFRDATFIAGTYYDGTPTLPSTLLKDCGYNDGRATYRRRGGTMEEMVLRMIPGPGAKPAIPELVIKDSLASVSGPFVRQHSSGFEARFVLAFARTFQDDTSMMSVRIPIDKSAAMTFVSPELQALVRTTPSRVMLALAIGCLVGGTFLLSLTAEQVADIPMLSMPLVKVSGALVMGLGAYIGFKKLPFKV